MNHNKTWNIIQYFFKNTKIKQKWQNVLQRDLCEIFTICFINIVLWNALNDDLLKKNKILF
jgi:hypothetical protein